MRRYLITYEFDDDSEIFEFIFEANSPAEARELANDAIWDMGGSITYVDELGEEES